MPTPGAQCNIVLKSKARRRFRGGVVPVGKLEECRLAEVAQSSWVLFCTCIYFMFSIEYRSLIDVEDLAAMERLNAASDNGSVVLPDAGDSSLAS